MLVNELHAKGKEMLQHKKDAEGMKDVKKQLKRLGRCSFQVTSYTPPCSHNQSTITSCLQNKVYILHDTPNL